MTLIVLILIFVVFPFSVLAVAGAVASSRAERKMEQLFHLEDRSRRI